MSAIHFILLAGLQRTRYSGEGLFWSPLRGQGWGDAVGQPQEPPHRAATTWQPDTPGDESQVFHTATQNPAASYQVCVCVYTFVCVCMHALCDMVQLVRVCVCVCVFSEGVSM